MKRFLYLLFCVCYGASVTAQDLHFSQFYNNPQHHNPALTGIFEGEWRAGANYRSQWETVPVQYRTAAAWGDFKWVTGERFMLATGLLVQSDRAGDAGLTWNQAGLQVSVAHAMGPQQALSVGLGAGLAQRSIDLSGLKFQNQWDGDLYNPGLSSQETIGNRSNAALTMSAGANWHYEPGGGLTRSRIDAGVGAYHLNRVKVNFEGTEDYVLPVRWTAQVHARFQVRAQTDIVAYALHQQMSSARESIIGGGLRLVLSPDMAAQLSAGWRVGDAVIPALQVEFGAWTAGLSYDWNVSQLQAVTRGRGGIELSVIHRSLPVKPPKGFKSCPIF
jgi:type IX secretion system PorP/SprF family membrane protein